MNTESKRCKFSERRIVYIVIGLLGSGKTTKVKSMVDTFESNGLKSAVVSPKGVGGILSELCKKEFNDLILDPTVRRIFLDNSNLWRDEREYYKAECESNGVEWIILSVGRFTKEASLKYLQYNDRGYVAEDYTRQLRLWSEYYVSEVLNSMEVIRDKFNYDKVRAMKDTRIVGIKSTPTGTVVALGLELDGSFVRSFLFMKESDALNLFNTATMTGFKPSIKAKVMTIGHHYKNSFTPL